MEASKRRKPAPHHRRPAPKKHLNSNTTVIIREIIGMAIAAAIFTATVWTSVFGMSGALDRPEVVQVAAGVGDDE